MPRLPPPPPMNVALCSWNKWQSVGLILGRQRALALSLTASLLTSLHHSSTYPAHNILTSTQSAESPATQTFTSPTNFIWICKKKKKILALTAHNVQIKQTVQSSTACLCDSVYQTFIMLMDRSDWTGVTVWSKTVQIFSRF